MYFCGNGLNQWKNLLVLSRGKVHMAARNLQEFRNLI